MFLWSEKRKNHQDTKTSRKETFSYRCRLEVFPQKEHFYTFCLYPSVRNTHVLWRGDRGICLVGRSESLALLTRPPRGLPPPPAGDFQAPAIAAKATAVKVICFPVQISGIGVSAFSKRCFYIS